MTAHLTHNIGDDLAFDLGGTPPNTEAEVKRLARKIKRMYAAEAMRRVHAATVPVFEKCEADYWDGSVCGNRRQIGQPCPARNGHAENKIVVESAHGNITVSRVR